MAFLSMEYSRKSDTLTSGGSATGEQLPSSSPRVSKQHLSRPPDLKSLSVPHCFPLYLLMKNEQTSGIAGSGGSLDSPPEASLFPGISVSIRGAGS